MALSTLARRVVLPLPRNPVTIVTGRLVSLPSMILSVMCGERAPRTPRRVQGIRGPARELRRGGPEGTEILDELGSPFAVAQHVLAPAPVVDAEAVVAHDLVGQDHPVSAVPAPVALERDRVGSRARQPAPGSRGAGRSSGPERRNPVRRGRT